MGWHYNTGIRYDAKKQDSFYFIGNKYDQEGKDHQEDYGLTAELGQRAKLGHLINHLTGRGENIHNWTTFGFKASMMTGMDTLPKEMLELGLLDYHGP